VRRSVKKGFSFGLTSGIITTLGLIIGLYSGTNSTIVILGGIFTIAIADAMSDSLGMHMSEESENKHSTKEIWVATISTFLSKFIVALTFVIPILFLQLFTAVIVCIIWGLSLITLFSYYLAKQQKIKPYSVISEHLTIAIIVIVVTYYVGLAVATLG